MRVVIDEFFSEKKRLETIKSAWITLGDELHKLAQSSMNIEDTTKDLLTQEICREYARQEICPVLQAFMRGSFSVTYDEQTAINLGKAICSFSSVEYENLVNQAKKQELLFDQKIEAADSDQLSK